MNLPELAKTVLIFLLIALLLGNVYLLFIKKNLKEEEAEMFPTSSIDRMAYIKPYKIRYSQGKENFYIFNDLDEKLCETLTEYFSELISSPVEFTKLSKINNRGDQLRMVSFSYSTGIPISLFMDSDESAQSFPFDSVKEIYFIADKKMELIVYTGAHYYRIKSVSERKDQILVKNFKERIKEIFSSNSLRYRQLSYIMNGTEKRTEENALVFPCRGYDSAELYKTKPEFDFSLSGTYGSIVNKIFEAKAPFVKEAENIEGDRLYLSEHGNDVLKISKDGSLEYKVEFSGAKRISTLQEDFATALKFNSKFGANSRKLRLERVEEWEKDAYFERRFILSPVDKVGNFHSRFQENQISIKIAGGRLIEYHRYMPILVKDRSEGERGITYSQRTIPELLSKKENYEALKGFYLRHKEKEKIRNREMENFLKRVGDEAIALMLQELEEFDLSYYESVKGKIRPCFRLRIGDAELRIDLLKKEGAVDELG